MSFGFGGWMICGMDCDSGGLSDMLKEHQQLVVTLHDIKSIIVTIF